MSNTQVLLDASTAGTRQTLNTGADVLTLMSSSLVYISFALSVIGIVYLLNHKRKGLLVEPEKIALYAFAVMSVIDGVFLGLTIQKKMKKDTVPGWYGYAAAAPYILACAVGAMAGSK